MRRWRGIQVLRVPKVRAQAGEQWKQREQQAEGLKELVVALKAHQAIDFIFKFEYV